MRFQTIAPAFAVAATVAFAFSSPAFAEDAHIGAGGHAGHAAAIHGGNAPSSPRGMGMTHSNASPGLQSNRGANVSVQHNAARTSFPAASSTGGSSRVANGADRHSGQGFRRGGVGGGYIGPDYGDYGSNDDNMYDDSGYAYGDPAYSDPNYAGGTQYSSDDNDSDAAPVQYGRSAAVAGYSCSTPVKVCTLYQPSYVGLGCSCRVPGGRAEGQVTP